MASRMTKRELVRYLALNSGTRNRTAAKFLESVQETAVRELRKKGTFALPGLGRLKTARRAARNGRTPQTGATIKTAPQTVVKFRLAKRAQDRIRLNTLRIVLASPGDVQRERDTVPEVIDELNRGVGELVGARFELSRWETDAHPGFHVEGPQGLIDRILRITDADVVIGIFWKRFGTPAKDAGSGTEHEFRVAYKAWKKRRRPEIMMYFREKSYQPRTKEETDQWGKVLEFRGLFPKEGLWWAYSDRREFERLVRVHLTNFLKDRTRKARKHA